MLRRIVTVSLMCLFPAALGAGSLPLAISPKSLPFGALGSGYSAQLTANGSGSYQWSVSQGNLPPGLSLGASSGTISGTATSGGTYPFVVTVVDTKFQEMASAGYTIGILNISNPSPLPSGSTAAPYSVTFNASDGPSGNYLWSIDAPPPGLQLNSNVLSGIPSASGTFSFTITTTTSPPAGAASATLSVSKSFVLTIGSGMTITTPPVLPAGDVNVAYAASLDVAGGTTPFAWSINGGAPPPGIGFDPTDPSQRTLMGTPTRTGSFNFTVQVQDKLQNIATKAVSLTINPALVITTPPALPGGTTGTGYAQIITASGGTPPYTFSLANGPPGVVIDPKTGLLSGTPTAAGTFAPVVTVKDFASQGFRPGAISQTFRLSIASSTPQVTVSPQSLSFSGAAGGDSPAPQPIAAFPAGASTGFRIVIDAGQDGSAAPAWLTVTPSAGNTPARLVVRVDQGSMPAGNYAGRIRVVDVSNNATDVPVTLALTGSAPQLDAAPRDLHFAARIQAPGTQEQIIVVRNSGGGGNVSFTTSVLGASPWIAGVTPNSGQTAHNAPLFLRVRVNTQGLRVGSYHDVVRLSSAAGNIDVLVALFVANSGSILGVDITGVTFHGQQGGGYSHPQTIRVLNLGDPGTSVNWAADVRSGEPLVSTGPPGGAATPTSPGTLTLTPNAGALASGGHYELIQISAPGSLNSPQYVVVVVDEAGASSPALPDPNPAGLFFNAAAGGAAPAQQVNINASAASPFQAAAATNDGANWLSASPLSGAAGPITVSVNSAGLAPGVYTGEVDISMSATVVAVGVTFAVRPSGTIAGPVDLPPAADAPEAGCTPSKVALTQTGLVNNFTVPAKWPAALIVQLNDDCGALLTSGSVVASFSNGDPPLSLRGDGQTGTYSTTWQAGTVTPRMVVTLQAAAGTLQPATAQLTGSVLQNQAPVLAKGGTVNAFFRTAGALAPGTVAEVYGSGLASGIISTGAPPLPTQSNGTFVLVAGTSAPLFYLSDGQLDVQIPSDLTPTQQYMILVSTNGALTLPDQIDLVPLQPGVSSFADGHIIAQHVDFTLVDASHPAKPGEAIVTYLLAMGPTNPSVLSGAPAPSSPLAQVTTRPAVTVDGQDAEVLFAGLTPGFAGLYQINFRVPANVHSGDLTMLVTQNGVASNATKLPVSP